MPAMITGLLAVVLTKSEDLTLPPDVYLTEEWLIHKETTRVLRALASFLIWLRCARALLLSSTLGPFVYACARRLQLQAPDTRAPSPPPPKRPPLPWPLLSLPSAWLDT
jgi:hypothetical protein